MVQDDFFVKTHENFEKTHSSQILRSWDKVFVKSSFLMCEGLNYPFKVGTTYLQMKVWFEKRTILLVFQDSMQKPILLCHFVRGDPHD